MPSFDVSMGMNALARACAQLMLALRESARSILHGLTCTSAFSFPKSRYRYMLGAKYGFAQSMDCAVQTMDPYLARQSMDFVRNPWIARI